MRKLKDLFSQYSTQNLLAMLFMGYEIKGNDICDSLIHEKFTKIGDNYQEPSIEDSLAKGVINFQLKDDSRLSPDKIAFLQTLRDRLK